MDASVSPTIGESRDADLHNLPNSAPSPPLPRAPRASRFRRRALLTFAALLVLYTVGYGSLLVQSNFVPYVTDNNESFSVLVHASNLVTFGLDKSFGLTDESFSPDAAAHPYVYTHGGNFPRLYGVLLYLLGARTIEAQLTIATFTVGVLALAAMFAYFVIVVGLRFASIACLIFGTDYLFFAQWQLNSYRVWHTVFFFGALLGVHGLARVSRRRLWLAITFVNYLCLYYFDFTFGVFVTLVGGLYALLLLRRSRGQLVATWIAQAAGAATSVVVLLAQDVAFTGLPMLIFDVTQTYSSRNAAAANTPEGAQFLASLADVYKSHHIVFWEQFGSKDPLRDPSYFLQAFFGWVLQPATPLFTYIMLVIIAGWAVGHLNCAAMGRLTNRVGIPLVGIDWKCHRDQLLLLSGAGLAAATFATSLALLQQPLMYAQADAQPTLGFAQILAALCITVAACLVFVGLSATLISRHLDFGRVALTVTFLLVIMAFLFVQEGLYDPQRLSFVNLGAWSPLWLDVGAVLVAVCLAAALVLWGTCRLLGDQNHATSALFAYLGCVVVGYTATYFLVPGYVVTGYLARLTPLPVYLRDVAFAIVFDVILVVLWRTVRPMVARLRDRQLAAIPGGAGYRYVAPGWTNLPGQSALIVAAASLVGLTAFVTVFWLGVQWQFLGLLPPTNLSYFDVLKDPAYSGASFTIKDYAAPVAVATGQWAYFDTSIESAQVQLTDAGYQVRHDADTYLWFADRATNPAYEKPDYYLCYTPQYLDTAAQILAGLPQRACAGVPIVQNNLQMNDAFPHDQVVATDDSGRNLWAIVRLDWDYPPFLSQLPDDPSGQYLQVVPTQISSGIALQTRYVSQQQEGVPLIPPVIRAYSVDSTAPCLLAQSDDASPLVLPQDFWGSVRVSVMPRTPTTAGKEYFSQPVAIGIPSFRLPDTRRGGEQVVRAASLAEAEEKAEAAGTWNPSAGSFGDNPVVPTAPTPLTCL